MADFVATDEKSAAPKVRFSEDVEVFSPEEVKKKGEKVRKQRNSRRKNAITKAQENEKQRHQENFEFIQRFADQLTPKILAAEVKQYVSEDMEEIGIKEQISGVPNNGQVPFTPISYCKDCVDRIAAYFSDENVAKNILKNDDDEGQVYIKDVKKLAILFLDVQKLHFYDHVTVEAFNSNAMKRGGPTYSIPLSMACLADAAGDLHEKLAGKETVCAAFSTGLAIQYGTSELTASSENSFKTHKQLLEENVDLDTIRSGCWCLKSDEWLMERVAAERKMERLLQKRNKKNNARGLAWEQVNKNCNWGNDDVSETGNDEVKEEEEKEVKGEEIESEEKRMEEVDEADVSGNQEDEEKEVKGEEIESEEKRKEEVDEAEKYSEEEDEENSEGVIFEQPEDVEDDDFRPRNIVQPVEKEEDFDNERWSNIRTTSSCLALCRHAPSCVVNAINKARILESLMLVRLPREEKEGIASITPGEYFAVVAHPNRSLIFSLGSTVYEAMARECDDHWNNASSHKSDDDDLSFIQSPGNTTAKVYTTVHTVAAPVFRSAPVCHINQQNKYGYYKTFRICIPGNFSGYYNDTSIDWRSELYSCITFSAAEAECRGDKKSYYSLLGEDEGIAAWPDQKPIWVEGGIVLDDSGDMSGNYLTFKGVKEDKTAVVAYANMRNLTSVINNLKEIIGELLTGTFKKQLVELKMLDIEITQTEEAAAAEGGELTVHETQYLNDMHTNMIQNAKFTAQSIDRYGKCLKSLERDLGTMNKYLSYNLKGYTGAAAVAYPKPDVFAYYL